MEESELYFPYEWFESVEMLDYPSLPPYSIFWSELKNKQKIFLGDEDVEERNYQHLQNVWSKWEMQTFQDFLFRFDN